jgi:hypothetical protein
MSRPVSRSTLSSSWFFPLSLSSALLPSTVSWREPQGKRPRAQQTDINLDMQLLPRLPDDSLAKSGCGTMSAGWG